jgi:RimJ/RimL family protein N-acetyltransferase
MTIDLRDTGPDAAADEAFIRNLLLDHAAAQLGAERWPEPMRSHLLSLQVESRLRSIRENHPRARARIVRIDGVDAGWLVTAESAARLRLVDILIAPGRRGRGAGTEVVRAVLREAGDLPVHLSVDGANAGAIRLYERLGFLRTGGDEARHDMERRR